MSRFVPTAALLLAAAAAAGAPAFAQQASAQASAQSTPQSMRDYEYSFRITGGDDDSHPTSGTMRVSGDRGRLYVDDKKDGGYMLLTDGGRTLTIVHPEKREYDVTDAASFERIVGTALHAVGPILKIDLEAAHVASDHLGAGGTVAGRTTQRVRLTQDFTIRVGALGFGGDAERHVVTTDYWISPGLTLMRNPLFGLIESGEAALVQSDNAYTKVLTRERDALLAGATPLRRVLTSRDEKGRTKTQTIEITALRATAPADARIFEIPDGYKRTQGVSWLTSR